MPDMRKPLIEYQIANAAVARQGERLVINCQAVRLSTETLTLLCAEGARIVKDRRKSTQPPHLQNKKGRPA